MPTCILLRHQKKKHKQPPQKNNNNKKRLRFCLGSDGATRKGVLHRFCFFVCFICLGSKGTSAGTSCCRAGAIQLGGLQTGFRHSRRELARHCLGRICRPKLPAKPAAHQVPHRASGELHDLFHARRSTSHKSASVARSAQPLRRPLISSVAGSPLKSAQGLPMGLQT